MNAGNPFKAATPVAKKLKVLFFGPSGSGKTVAALSFPKVALIDAEGGADLYAGRPGIAPFSILRTKTVKELEEAIAFIKADNGKTFETLVIDPITVFYDVLKDAAQRAREAQGKEMTYREWAKINQRMRSIYNQLSQLPVHVIVIAREAVEYEGAGDSLKKTGVKPDADKAAAYLFDYAIKLNPDHTGTVQKSRGFDIGSKLPKVEWSVFEKASLAFTDGESVQHQNDEDAVNRETEQFSDTWYDDPEKRKEFFKYLANNYALSEQEAVKLAGKPLHEFPTGKEAKDTIVAALSGKIATPKNGS